jgi:hypothetical protein
VNALQNDNACLIDNSPPVSTCTIQTESESRKYKDVVGKTPESRSQETEGNESCHTFEMNNDVNKGNFQCRAEQNETVKAKQNYISGDNQCDNSDSEIGLGETIDSFCTACWYFHAEIEGKKMPLLFDTGSPLSILSRTNYDALGERKPVLEPLNSKLYAANGSQMNIMGKANFKFKTEVREYNWTFAVADIEGHMGIIGQDFIGTQGRSLTWKNLTWLTKAGKIKLFKRKSDKVGKVVIKETVSVPPESELFVKGVPNYPLYDDINVVEPLSYWTKKGLLVAKSLLNSEGDSVYSVMNLTDKPIKLKQGEFLGSISSAEKSESLDNRDCKDRFSRLPEYLQCLVNNVDPSLSANEKHQFHELLLEFQDIFMGPDGKLGQTDLVTHSIDTGDAKPVRLPPRKVPLAQQAVIEQEVEKMHENGIIEPSDSPWSAPICLVKKSDGSHRFAIDFRGLNSVTIKDAYPLPNIRQIFDNLAHSRFYNTLDMASGYWQIKMAERDKKKTGFVTPTGRNRFWHFLVMPFGLCNSGATFERLMERVLAGLQWSKCLCYVDDVIVYGQDFPSTLSNLREVFLKLREAKLCLKPSKCKFFQKKVSFLGHIASEEGTTCDPSKIECIQKWPEPRTKKEVQSFLGLVNFYRVYIKNCSEIAEPLTHLTKKLVKFKWDHACQIAFDTLKQKLTEPPVLSYPNSEGQFILQTDASGVAIAAILSQDQGNREAPISYASKTLSSTQRNYCTTMRELLAVVTFVKQFKHYLYGRHFVIRTDHASLSWLKNFKDPDGLLSRWLSILDTYDYTIEYRKGSDIPHVDALSRIPNRKCKNGGCEDCHKVTDGICPSRPPYIQRENVQSGRAVAGAETDLKSVNTDSGSVFT